MLELYFAPQKGFSRGLFSNKMVHLHTGFQMFVGFWMH